MEKRKEDYDDLLASIRRLTVMVLDNLEAGSKDSTLDQGQKTVVEQHRGAAVEALANCSA